MTTASDTSWDSRRGRGLLRDLIEKKKPLAPFVRDADRPFWERAILRRSVGFIQKQVASPRNRFPVEVRVRSLARTLDALHREASVLNVGRSWLDQRRFRGNRAHLELLQRSLGAPDEHNEWNEWRRRNSRVVPDLRRVNLGGLDVRHVRLAGARLAGAEFGGGSLRVADLSGADLRGCGLSEVDASYATLRNADLRKAVSRSGQFAGADLRGADLRGAMLIGCGLNQVQLQGADLRGALTWGCGVWDIERDAATREDGLLIGWEFLDPIDASLYPKFRPAGPQFRVDRLEVAHFLALVRSEPDQLAHIVDAASRHIVLLLGRFTGDQRATLEALRRALPEHGFAPVVFDFEPPKGRDIVETVATLAGLAHFIIADLSQPRSTPLEAQLIVPTLAVPYVPIIRAGERPFSMFAALQRKYPWVLPTVTYRSEKDLLRKLEKQVIDPARRRATWLRSKKNVAALMIPAR